MKDDVIHCRVNPETKERIKEFAKEQGLSITEYVINKALEDTTVANPKTVKKAIKELCDVYTEINKNQALFVLANKNSDNFYTILEKVDELQCTLISLTKNI